MTEAVLAVLVPVALMAGALAMQRFEHHLLGPAPHADEEGPGWARAGRRSARTAGSSGTEVPVAATTAPHGSAPKP